jgi:type I restriction enzyme S subunit
MLFMVQQVAKLAFQKLKVLCIRSKTYDKLFLLNFLQLTKTAIVGKYLQGGQGNLSADIVKGLIIPTACEIEQKKIADFIKAIDNKIISATIQIQQTIKYKKSLLQNMFC